MKNGTIQFTKMHGLGNDFVVINATTNPVSLHQFPIQQFSDRNVGIGFDQLLVIEPSKQADFYCRIYNSDGSEAEQCGNGLRCVARYLHEEKMLRDSSITIETKAGIFPITIQDYDHIRVTMGAPSVQENLVSLKLKSSTQPISVISTGNPHAILKVESVDQVIPTQLGSEISIHSHFPHGANVGFMQIVTPHHIRLRTFERGAGETHACGSNACAAAVAGIVNGWLKNKVDVEFRFGQLMIEWEGEGKPLYMTGPAAKVFAGIV